MFSVFSIQYSLDSRVWKGYFKVFCLELLFCMFVTVTVKDSWPQKYRTNGFNCETTKQKITFYIHYAVKFVTNT